MGSSGNTFKYMCDMDKKSVLISNFEKRGWVPADPDNPDDWQFYWASVPTVRDLFSLDNKARRLQPNQMVNHFPTFYELTRKVRRLFPPPIIPISLVLCEHQFIGSRFAGFDDEESEAVQTRCREGARR